MTGAVSSLRMIPPMHRLLATIPAVALVARFGADAAGAALRAEVAALRERLREGAEPLPDPAAICARAERRLAAARRPALRRTINATGIVLHTNLGRAPLAREAIEAAAAVAAGYCNLEFDLATGRRGERSGGVETLLRDLTGAQAALPVNNGAAAILLALAAMAPGGEVVISRGELVEIGGGFRIPDVIAQSGARLVEVGTTNRTRLADYRAVIGPATRVLLKVHQSNFRMVGFTSDVPIADLAALGQEHRVPVVADLGSGLLRVDATGDDPGIAVALADGADVVTCSGDKLLGGPQAGLILGSAAPLAAMRAHPLMRALRLDKLVLAALETTLILHRDAPAHIPVERMLRQSVQAVAERAARLLALVGTGEIVETEAYAGGGALSARAMPSRAVAIVPMRGLDEAAAMLRTHDPAVIARLHRDRLLLDLLTVADEEVPDLAAAVRSLPS